MVCHSGPGHCKGTKGTNPALTALGSQQSIRKILPCLASMEMLVPDCRNGQGMIDLGVRDFLTWLGSSGCSRLGSGQLPTHPFFSARYDLLYVLTKSRMVTAECNPFHVSYGEDDVPENWDFRKLRCISFPLNRRHNSKRTNILTKFATRYRITRHIHIHIHIHIRIHIHIQYTYTYTYTYTYIYICNVCMYVCNVM